LKKQLIMLLVLLLMTVPLIAQEDEISPELTEHLAQLEAQVEEIRDLELDESINRLFPSPEEVLDFIYSSLEEELDDQLVFEETLFYRAFNFVEGDFDLVGTYLNLLGSQVAGFYDPETNNMNTLLISGGELGDTLPIMEQIIYAHEYTHALQDATFDLSAFIETIEDGHPDQILAATAVFEGDATLVMQEYLTELTADNPAMVFAALGQILSLSASGATEIPEGTPAILEAELTMPYLDGLNFAVALRNQGGWDAVDEAFRNPPRSTEQVLHPESYFNGDEPVAVVLAPTDDLFDDAWAVILERPLGEFYLREHIKTGLSSASAIRAAAGWGGDLFRLYYNKSEDSLAWVLRLTWDTQEDAAQFVEIYTLLAEKRAEAEPTESNGIACWEIVESDEGLCLADFDGESVVGFGVDVDIAAQLVESQR